MIQKQWWSFFLLLALVMTGCGSDDEPTGPEPGVTPTLPVLSIVGQAVAEGDTASFVISLDTTGSKAVAFSYHTEDVTATSGSDYLGGGGVVTIAVNATQITVKIPTLQDTEHEGMERFRLVLRDPENATLVDSVEFGVIFDDDVGFASQVQPLLKTSCAKPGTCHAGGFPGGDFYLGPEVLFIDLMAATGNNTASLPGSADGLVVQSGSSAASTLYTKTTPGYPFGGRMPAGGAAPLSEDQQNLIRDWIDQGALDN